MKILVYCFLILFLALSCKKDGVEANEDDFKTTPYDFPFISNFRTFVDDPQNPLTNEGVDLGHYLFFDNRLSKDFTMSCASCHQPENGFSDPKRWSIGVEGLPGKRHSMSLLNLAWSKQFFWDGRAATLREQALSPVTDPLEMNSDWNTVVERIQAVPTYREKFKKAFNTEAVTSDLITKAIEQYVKTLVVYNSDFDKAMRGEKELSVAAKRGQALFNTEKADCFHCHTTPELLVHGSTTFMNNGLDLIDNPNDFSDWGLGGFTGKSSDNGKFKIPTLRNLRATAPYMHDGRFSTLEEVIDFYNQGPKFSPSLEPIMIAEANRRVLEFNRWGLGITEEEKKDLIAFLESMTDNSYLNDPHYLAPEPLK
ncbi:MAG: c-type cytochrome [Chitinophagales bacterium]|nr:c-type cytochrome [Chitinophagales bacterium]